MTLLFITYSEGILKNVLITKEGWRVSLIDMRRNFWIPTSIRETGHNEWRQIKL